MPILLSFLIAFFIGAIPTAYIFVKCFKNTDIREQGSGNVGATNAARVLGRKLGLLIFAIDFLKGFLPALVLSKITQNPLHLSLAELAEFIGFWAILGHIFTPFLGGRGGKGIATGAGVICAGYPIIFILLLLVWTAIFFAVRRTVSLASLGAIFSFIIFSLLFKSPRSIVIYAVVLFLLASWTHRSNISRWLQGEEISKS